MKRCVIDQKKACNDCNRCNVCDLDPHKICDNCFKCLELDDRDYIDIPISDIYTEIETDAFEINGMHSDFTLADYTVKTVQGARGKRKR